MRTETNLSHLPILHSSSAAPTGRLCVLSIQAALDRSDYSSVAFSPFFVRSFSFPPTGVFVVQTWCWRQKKAYGEEGGKTDWRY